MLWLTHTLSEPSPLHVASHVQTVFFVFLLTQILITEKLSSHTKLYLIDWFLLCVSSCSSSPTDQPLEDSLLRNTFIIPFLGCVYICFYSGVAWHIVSVVHISWHMFFHTLQVFRLALTSFGNLTLWLTWMVPFCFKDYETGSGSLNSFHI